MKSILNILKSINRGLDTLRISDKPEHKVWYSLSAFSVVSAIGLIVLGVMSCLLIMLSLVLTGGIYLKGERVHELVYFFGYLHTVSLVPVLIKAYTLGGKE